MTLVLPCGTGKTIVAGFVIAETRPELTVVFEPTVWLSVQTAARLGAENPDAKLVLVCSPGRAAPDDELSEVDQARRENQPVTTQPETIAAAVPAAAGKLLIVVATYTSAAVVAKACALTGREFDLMILDEGHHTAGTADKAWAMPLSDRSIPARLRLFMTATPRVIAFERRADRLDAADVEVVSMASVAHYGPHVAPLTWRQAIDAGHLSDYRIAVVAVSRQRALDALAATGDYSQARLRSAAAQLALIHTATSTRGLRSVMVFHNRVARSKLWAQTLRALAAAVEPGIDVQAYHIDGETSSAWTTQALDALSAPGDRLVTVSNCRVFGEGVDVPSLDGILFADPRTSHSDIVQCVGRAVRPHPGGSRRPALIILPVIVGDDDSADIDTDVTRAGHLAAWQVLTALADQDELLHECLARWRGHVEHGTPAPTDGPVAVDVSGLGPGAHTAFTFRTIARAASPYVLTAARLRDFRARYGHTRPRSDFMLGDYPLGKRCAAVRSAYRGRRLHPRIVDLFEAVPGWTWSTTAPARRRSPGEWIALVEHYVAQSGVRSVPRAAWVFTPDAGERANIGEWLHTKANRRSYLTVEQRRQLDGILGGAGVPS